MYFTAYLSDKVCGFGSSGGPLGKLPYNLSILRWRGSSFEVTACFHEIRRATRTAIAPRANWIVVFLSIGVALSFRNHLLEETQPKRKAVSKSVETRTRRPRTLGGIRVENPLPTRRQAPGGRARIREEIIAIS